MLSGISAGALIESHKNVPLRFLSRFLSESEKRDSHLRSEEDIKILQHGISRQFAASLWNKETFERCNGRQ